MKTFTQKALSINLIVNTLKYDHTFLPVQIYAFLKSHSRNEKRKQRESNQTAEAALYWSVSLGNFH